MGVMVGPVIPGKMGNFILGVCVEVKKFSKSSITSFGIFLKLNPIY